MAAGNQIPFGRNPMPPATPSPFSRNVCRYPSRLLWGILFLLVVFAGTAAAAGSIQSYLGDTVRLSGYCYTSPTVYLFLTGPNLPVNGVALDNINNPADQGGFTQVSVDSNNHWQYDWGTGSVGGRLDAGTYTVWAVDSPNSLANLNQAQYSTISVTLSVPGLGTASASTVSGAAVPEVPGILNISSVPEGSSVVVNGNYEGRSPLSLPGLAPGTYTVNVSRFNYYPLSTSAAVQAGATTEVTATLTPKTGSISIDTAPEGANVSLDGVPVGVSPVTRDSIPAGNHTVNATLAGYLPNETGVTIIADQPVTSTILLVRPPSAIPGISTPLVAPVTIGACAGALLLFGLFRPRSGV